MAEVMTEEALFDALALECRVGTYGAVCYYNALGKLHRVYGPAVEYADGHREWWQNGQLHRLDGPAVEWPDGRRAWWQNGQRHRLDGPAVEWPDGRREWYIEGVALPKAQFLAKGGVMPSDDKCCQQSPV